MSPRTCLLVATAACIWLSHSLPAALAESPGPDYKRLAVGSGELKKKNGYWVECRYSSIYGEVCETVYMGTVPKNGKQDLRKMRPVTVGGVKLRKKNGYWIECRYSGLGEVCEYVYARPKN